MRIKTCCISVPSAQQSNRTALNLTPRVCLVFAFEKAKLEPQNAEEGEFTDLEGLDLMSKLDLLRKNEQWKCQVKKEALEVRSDACFSCLTMRVCMFVSRDERRKTGTGGGGRGTVRGGNSDQIVRG